MKRVFLYPLVLLLLLNCKKEQKEDRPEAQIQKIDSPASMNEKYRPQFHFTPKEKWMNDPNGLVYHNGIYHLFYQHYPEDIVWGPMHWGHATSMDLIHWKHQPIALYPDKHGLIFSGSAVVDKKNTAGFGKNGKTPLVAIFTYHSMEGEKAGRDDFQTQGIAYSLDDGQTWTKYKGNPVIGNPTGIRDFRDPKVFWHRASRQWIMILVAGDHAKFYSSPNLKDWTHLSDFGKDKGAHGGVWECPDLFKMKVQDSEEEKWVLLISINPGAPNGGSGTQYFVGDFDGITFTTDQKETKWIDRGMDNYAGITYNNAPYDRRVFIGWMSNWNYARDTPTKVWRSAMTMPRDLRLVKEQDVYFLKSQPIRELGSYIGETLFRTDIVVDSKKSFSKDFDDLNRTAISFDTNLSKDLKLTFSNKQGDSLVIGVDTEQQQLFLDRSASGIVNFEKSFAERPQVIPIDVSDKDVPFELYLDRSSIELFVEKGKYVLTAQVFPNVPYTNISISADKKAELSTFTVQPIRSSWDE
ncbi:glycoside hydrolase family 32 protein [Sungkyunkwania multivorans]|uniref:Glycoside hydrolase family 32 protein n=1 Tax=Sungkyunkwania multivorans TaxID=1173618 RepID=A0ABW3CWF5_9FLAO